MNELSVGQRERALRDRARMDGLQELRSKLRRNLECTFDQMHDALDMTEEEIQAEVNNVLEHLDIREEAK